MNILTLMKRLGNSKHGLFLIVLLLLVFLSTGCSLDGSIKEVNGISSKEISSDSEENVDIQAIALNEDKENLSQKEKVEKVELTNESTQSQKEISPQELPNPSPAKGKLSVHFVDVGQGDANLLVGPDFTILIDAGRHDQNEVVPYLKSVGIKEIDLVIGTHPFC